jgi:protease-4
MEEVVLIKSNVKQKVLVIDLNGPISTVHKPGMLNRNGDIVSNIYYRLKKASEDPLIKGIILRLDTPGGEGTASDIVYNEVLRFKEKTGVPVVALMMGMAASGGYYVACACDTIFAHRTAITGSIGVIAVLPGVKGAMDKLGIKMHIIKSGKMKDTTSPFKELNDEEKDYIQELVDHFHKGFVQVVYQGRKGKLSLEEIERIADGRIYSAQEALKLKLIDEIGYFDDALENVFSAASITDANVVAYTYFPGKKTNVYANTSAALGSPFLVEVNLFENLLPSLKAGIYYLWQPQLFGD